MRTRKAVVASVTRTSTLRADLCKVPTQDPQYWVAYATFCVESLRPGNVSDTRASSYEGHEFDSRHILLLPPAKSGSLVEVTYYAVLFFHLFSAAERLLTGRSAVHSGILISGYSGS